MFFLHVSNKTENLLRHLAEVIRQDKQSDLFTQELFLIQSQGMERVVAQSLADEFRSFCNFRFFLPLDFISFISEILGIAVEPDGFRREVLTWRLDGLLRDVDDPLFRPLQLYLQGENRDLKRFQLARRLANLFDQYQLMRGEMIRGWQRKLLLSEHPAEPWQMELWNRLVNQPGGAEHRALLFERVGKRLEDGEHSLLPKRISIIGLHIMPPVYLRFLNSLATHMDVHLYLLSPCEKFWGNVESKRSQFRRLVNQDSGNGLAPLEEHHPLLAALGQQGRDLQNMMLDEADFALEFTSYENPLGEGDKQRGSLLYTIQADLLQGAVDLVSGWQPPDNDSSVRIVSCHSKLRELTILKDHLLELLHSDHSLELKDIIVMAPDIQEYAALIPGIFSTVQHSIADRSVRRRNSVIGAFSSFLQLFSGRFGLSEVLDLLQRSVVYPQFDLSPADLENLQQWVADAGIRWGLSADQRQDLGLMPFDESSWRGGLDRLLMGYAVDSDEFVDGVLPFTGLEGRGAGPLGGLCAFVELLEARRLDFSKPHSLEEWAQLLHSSIDTLFGGGDEDELLELRTLVAELAGTGRVFHQHKLTFDVIREWFKQSARESRSSAGFLRGQLTFCSMLPMRSVPFRVVCLLGLNDGVFPKNDHQDTFDLMNVARRSGDRSPRADDRYQFLEAILAARSTLYLSFVGQSMKTNERIPPSVVLSEFIELLEKNYGLQDPVVYHPLHPFNSNYFREDVSPGLFSYDPDLCRIARAIREEKGEGQIWWQGFLEPVTSPVSIVDLISFYRNPARYFVRNRLGINLDIGTGLPDDRESFRLAGLEAYQVDQDLLDSLVYRQNIYPEERPDTLTMLRKLQVRGGWPLGTGGGLSFEKKIREVENFRARVETLDMGERLTDLPLEVEAGPCTLVGTLSHLYQGGLLLLRFGRFRGQDLLGGWIHHLLVNHQRPGTDSVIITPENSYRFPGTVAVDGTPGLEYLLDCYLTGCCRPLGFYVEPAFAYARQQASSRAQKPPLEVAGELLKKRLNEGYEPELELLMAGRDDLLAPGGEFEQLARLIMCSIWEIVNE